MHKYYKEVLEALVGKELPEEVFPVTCSSPNDLDDEQFDRLQDWCSFHRKSLPWATGEWVIHAAIDCVDSALANGNIHASDKVVSSGLLAKKRTQPSEKKPEAAEQYQAAKTIIENHLAACAQELDEWYRTGLLCNGWLRQAEAQLEPIFPEDATRMAEKITLDLCLKLCFEKVSCKN